MANHVIKRLGRSTLLCAFLLATILAPQTFAQGETRQPQKAANSFRVVESLVGGKGKTQGTNFIVEDQRTTFRVPQDKQVIVYFEWEGPPGPHHFQGTWREPTGKVDSVGTFDFVAQGPDFSGYWILQLNSSVPRGLWVLEAQIDGKPAGERTFQITGPPPPPPPPPVLTTAQVYQKVLASSVFVTALDSGNEPIRTGSGFFIRPGVVLTTFGVIDGSASLQLQLPDGTSRKTDTVLAWNREQDWALLGVEGTKVPPLKLAKPGSWKVGDACYVTDSLSPGARSITPVAITGILDTKNHGRLFTISWSGSGRAVGSPALNRKGQVIGVVRESPNFAGNSMPLGIVIQTGIPSPAGPQVIPISTLQNPSPTVQTATLAALAARGLFVPPVSHDPQIIAGYLCKQIVRAGQSLVPALVTSQFFHRDKDMDIIVTWAPNEKADTTEQIRIYGSEDNGLRIETKPKKIKLKPHDTVYTGWKIPISALPSGIYRVDVLLGTTPEWRSFFRIAN
jgi:S1-C subfamily serine protease